MERMRFLSCLPSDGDLGLGPLRNVPKLLVDRDLLPIRITVSFAETEREQAVQFHSTIVDFDLEAGILVEDFLDVIGYALDETSHHFVGFSTDIDGDKRIEPLGAEGLVGGDELEAIAVRVEICDWLV